VSIDRYFTLGRSGLRVSRLALGTMTFGTEWGWGADEANARLLFDAYLDAGGNFVDTADLYTSGTSEAWLGRFIAERGARDRVVIATKFSYNAEPGNPNAGGNQRTHALRAVEGSLRRLRTDYIDLYVLHVWDLLTSPEEVIRTFDDLVRAGKIRYVGLSNVPAWYAARMQTLAEWRGYEPVTALQYEYSLVERNIEREHVPLALASGTGVMVWSPLGSGLLSGKYRASERISGRLETMRESNNPGFKKFNERNWKIVAELEAVANELGQPMAAVALNWVTHRPAVASVIVGATSMTQLRTNLQALTFTVPSELAARLEQVSRPEQQFPYSFYGPEIQGMVHGGKPVGSKPAGYHPDVVIEGPGAGVQ
jgi:aryl-alcohol dehydrogenase-like predicted oxidoreductase